MSKASLMEDLCAKIALELLPRMMVQAIPEPITRILLETLLALLTEEQQSNDQLNKLVGSYYKTGIEYLTDAKDVQEKRRDEWIQKALDHFFTASEVEDALLQAKSQFYVGVCYDLLNESNPAKRWYEKAYESASQMLVQSRSSQMKSGMRRGISMIGGGVIGGALGAIGGPGGIIQGAGAGAGSAYSVMQGLQEEERQKQVAELGDFMKPLSQVLLAHGSTITSLISRPRKEEEFVLIRTIKGHLADFLSLAISPDDQILVSGGKNIRIWNLHNGELLRTLTDYRVLSLAISPDGQILASATSTGTIKVWNLQSGELLHDSSPLKGHFGYVFSLAISPDGQTLVSGGTDSKAKVWNLHTGELLYTLQGELSIPGSVLSLAISPDGQTLVSGCSYSKIRVWNLHSRNLLHILKFKDLSLLSDVRSVVISPDGQTLVSGGGKKIRIWNLHTGEMLRTLTDNSALSLAISRDSQVLLSGNAAGEIKVWSLHSGELLHILTAHSGAIRSLAISSDGQIMVSGSETKIMVWGEK